MAILIENMEMPNACYECALSNTCDLPSPYYVESTRPHGCPLQEVVRCKDCKHFHDGIYNGEYWMECDEYRIALSSDKWFCADGERREDDKG